MGFGFWVITGCLSLDFSWFKTHTEFGVIVFHLIGHVFFIKKFFNSFQNYIFAHGVMEVWKKLILGAGEVVDLGKM